MDSPWQLYRPQPSVIPQKGSSLSRMAGETRRQRLEQATQLPQDQSQILHEFPDGWTVRQPGTYGDLHREGELMGNCWSATPTTGAEAHPAWEYSPIEHDDPSNEEIAAVAHVPLGGAYAKSFYSLRDPDNLPHLSVDEMGEALGRHNAEPKDEYLRRIQDWADAAYPEGWEYGGGNGWDSPFHSSWGRISSTVALTDPNEDWQSGVAPLPQLKQADRVTQSETELCVMLDLPEAARKKIHGWVLEQDWPEGTELHEPEKYHITLMYTPSGYDEHKDADWIEHLESAQVRVTGIDVFTEDPKEGYPYVLRLDAPEVREHAEEMQRRAEEDHGLEITHFPGGYKPHITVGYGPVELTEETEVLPLEFEAGPSCVSEPREDEEDPDSSQKSGSSSSEREEAVMCWNLDGLHDVVIPHWRMAVKAHIPPDLRAASGKDRCGNCLMWDKSKRVCWGYGNRGPNDDPPVDEHKVCDSYDPAPGYHEAALPEQPEPQTYGEAQLLDQLSLHSVGHNLHYKFQEGVQDPAALKGYAERLLKMIGYDPDELNTMAALQAWQTLYPQDRALPSGAAPELPETAGSDNSQAPPTVPSESWGYGTVSGHRPGDLVQLRHADNDRTPNGATDPGAGGPRRRRGLHHGVASEHQPLSAFSGGGWGEEIGQPEPGHPDPGGGPEDPVGLLAGSSGGARSAGWRRASFVSPELGAILDAFGDRYGVTLLAEENGGVVSFNHIEIPPQNRGGGVGTRLMSQLKSYCDRRGESLRVNQVVNVPFFSSLGWMHPVAPDTFLYEPHSGVREPEQDGPTEPTPEDRWPEWGQRSEDEIHHYDVPISNDVLV